MSVDPLEAYADAKSRADVEGALAVCTDDFVLDTIPYRLVAAGKDEARYHLSAFFQTFPDYEVALEGRVDGDGVTTCWGVVSATMTGPLFTAPPTGESFALPMCCVFDVADGLLARERFFFDLNQMCEQLNLPVGLVARDLETVRRYLGEREATHVEVT